MTMQYISPKLLFAGILGVAVGGCSGSETGVTGTGGTTGGVQTSGGTAAGGNSGSVRTGGSGHSETGGILGIGGSTRQPETGGMFGTGGSTAPSVTGGATTTGGAAATGGATTTGGKVATGGATATGGAMAMGGKAATGGAAATAGKAATGGAAATGGNAATGGTKSTSGGSSSGTCTASVSAGKSVTGTGPHKVVVESNSGSQISCGTIYRPADLAGSEKYPIFVWGEGGCARSGTSNQAAMGEIASHGYFVVADGPAGSGGNCGSISMSTDVVGMAKPLQDYINWAIAENDNPCSAYYQSLDTTKIAADGFSCGGLMAMGTAGDSRITTWGITSSGLTSAVSSFYKTIHTPVKILLGGSGDVAYPNGERDYDQISALGIPIILLSKDGAGHGGDLSKGTGDFNSVNLAWINWQLKGDTTATGKGALVGSTCKYCNVSGWEYKSANIP